MICFFVNYFMHFSLVFSFCFMSTNFVLELMPVAKPLTKEQIEDRVRSVVVNYLQVTAESVTQNSRFVDDLGADSLDLTELAVAFEDEFNLEIPDADFGQLSTVAGVVGYLDKRLN